MPGDYSRKTFDRTKHYSGVLMQQGRVQVDADWNEQLAIQLNRTETETRDVVGASGVPKGTNGFKIGVASGGGDLTIEPGRIYVGGALCELEPGNPAATYSDQPHYPNPEFLGLQSPPGQLGLADGKYLVYLEAWGQEITALDDARIREVALGGPDTSARLKTVWQVRILPESGAALSCESDLNALLANTTGTLNARTVAASSEEDPCELPPTSGYRRLENQLYRVEIHKEGDSGQARFKWSRDNATVETRIESIAGAVLTVSDVGKDDVLGFAGDQWVEIVDAESELNRHTLYRSLFLVDSVDPSTRRITLKSSAASLSGRENLKIRRWDQTGVSAGADGVLVTSGWVALEGGIQVEFSSGTYRAGDYWLIPARTATTEIEWPPYEVPNVNPIAQPPHGVRRHRAALALLTVSDGEFSLEDCREEFPTLTGLCAEDICFDNGSCDLTDVETVQDAIDRLCAARDLRHHNKHLHGWGIVCGLQVACGPDPAGTGRQHVTVKPGYAIDCEGNDIILETSETVDLFDLIEEQIGLPPASGSPPAFPDMDVCLVLDRNSENQHQVLVEPYSGKTSMKSLLDGTLLMDFYNDCIKSLVDFFSDQFTPDPNQSKLPVSPVQKRFTALLNLLVQIWDTQNGRFVFLSGDEKASPKDTEHLILKDFYDKLKAKLQSETFCAMFDGARPFPSYPFPNIGTTTIFGKGFHTRLRLSPDGARGYTVGTTNQINVYDLKKNVMIAEVEFPGGTAAVVQDVALSRNGNEIYAVALLNNKDTMFVAGNVTASGINWQKPTVICDVLMTSIATMPSVSGNVFAIGRGLGIYEIDPQNVSATPSPRSAFNAVGHLVVDEQSASAFATAAGPGMPSTEYDRVLQISLKQNVTPMVYTLGGMLGTDDLLVTSQGAQKGKLYVVVRPAAGSPTKHVLVFNLGNGIPFKSTDLQDDTVVRLGENPETGLVMVVFDDSHRVGILDKQDDLELKFRQPVQIFPISIASSAATRMVYVLNFLSNTLTAIPASKFSTAEQMDLQALAAYRAAIIDAFIDLLAGLLQYLKDCFCHHLLINCPTCDEDDKIYLACVSIRNGQVHQVCNFSKRKYVKSFPTVEYWLSLVPIWPIVHMVVEKFCCTALPLYFGQYAAATASAQTGSSVVSGTGSATKTLGFKRALFTGTQARSGVLFTQQTDFRSMILNTVGLQKIIGGTSLASDWVGATIQRAPQPAAVVGQGDIVNKPVAEAQTKLESAGIIVAGVEKYDPSRGGRNLVKFAGAPVRLAPGTRVTLMEQDGQVRYYAIADAAPPPIEDLRAELNANRAAVAATASAIEAGKADLAEALLLRAEVSRLESELRSVQKTHQDALLSRDQEIATLKTQASDFQTGLRTLRILQKQVDDLARTRPTPRKKS